MKWLCSNCEYVENINLYGYDISNMKNNIGIKYIYPICCNCNSREKTPEGIKYYSEEVYNEIIEQIRIGIALNKKVVINHIFSKDDYNRFCKMLDKINVKPFLVILMPDLELSIERTQKRATYIKNKKTSTQKTTVEHFYKMMEEYDKEKYLIVDNSNLSIGETIEYINNKKTAPNIALKL